MLSMDSMYQVFRQDRRLDRKGGGVCALVGKSIPAVRVPCDLLSVSNMCDGLCFDLCGKFGVRFMVCYRPPSTPALDTTELFHQIGYACTEPKPIVICGDFNMPSVNWDTLHSLPNQPSEIIISNNLTQLVAEPTTLHERNILDLVFVNEDDLVVDLETTMSPVSADHHALTFSVFVERPPENHSTSYIDFHNADYAYANHLLGTFNWSDMYSISDVNKCYGFFLGVIHWVIGITCPLHHRRQTNSRKPPLYIRRLYKEKLRRYRRRTPDTLDDYLTFCKYVDEQVTSYVDELEDRAVSGSQSSSFFKYINRKLHSRPVIGPLQNDDGSLIEDNLDMCETLAKQYTTAFCGDNGLAPEFPQRTNAQIDTITFRVEEVFKKLNSLPNKSTSTPDNVPPIFLRNTSFPLAEPLSFIYQLSMSSSRVPDLWRHAIVKPMFKKGDRKKAENYRPISLTSCIGKVMESIVKRCLLDYLQAENLLSSHQHGFLPRRSTLTCVMDSMCQWLKDLGAGNPVDVIYFDFAKAFDVVCHQKLVHKLAMYGIASELLGWLRDFISGRSHSVHIGNSSSLPRQVSSGVVQGSVIGPLLFCLYINDLPDVLSSIPLCRLSIFADDTQVSSPDPFFLQTAIDQLAIWADTWQLQLAPHKTEHLHLGSKGFQSIFNINNTQIVESDSVKDLGVVVDRSLGSSLQCVQLAKRASRISGLILTSLRTRRVEVFRKAFCSLVLPILDYLSSCWSPYLVRDINAIEAVQRTFTRRVLFRCGYQKMPYPDRLKLLKLVSLEERRIRTDLVLVYKLVHQNIEMNCDDFFSRSVRQTRGHTQKLNPTFIPWNAVSTNFFPQRIYSIWNSLPREVVSATDINAFRFSLSRIQIGHLFQTKIR